MKFRIACLAFVVMFLASAVAAQQAPPVLRPPKGSKLAIVVFEDMECSACAYYESALQDAVKAYHIPLVRRDYPIPGHVWSFKAHVIAYWYEEKSPQLAEEFRHWVFVNQQRIYLGNFQQKMNEFAHAHGVQLPPNVEKNGALIAKVNANRNAGQALGIYQTPTVYIVGEERGNFFFFPVSGRDRLFATIDEAKARINAGGKRR